jgi:hypothetical protein
METYIRKPLATAACRDENGEVIDDGKRWYPAGPPQDSYSRISNAGRFGPLQRVTENLIAYLLRNYDADRAATDGHEFGYYQPTIPAKLFKLVPADPAASPITSVTSAQGTSLHCGVMFNGAFPACACDACEKLRRRPRPRWSGPFSRWWAVGCGRPCFCVSPYRYGKSFEAPTRRV